MLLSLVYSFPFPLTKNLELLLIQDNPSQCSVSSLLLYSHPESLITITQKPQNPVFFYYCLTSEDDCHHCHRPRWRPRPCRSDPAAQSDGAPRFPSECQPQVCQTRLPLLDHQSLHLMLCALDHCDLNPGLPNRSQ